jgi:transposase
MASINKRVAEASTVEFVMAYNSGRSKRVKCTELHAKGNSYRHIAKEVGVSRQTAMRNVRLWEEDAKIKPDPRPGPSPKLSDRDNRYIRRLSERNPHARDSGLNVAPRTISNALREMDLHVLICRRKPYQSA